jgi:coenzyme F420-reducing hydrogenase beta subunit
MYFDSLDKSECCGCNACGDICNQGAITFSCDEEEFWYPVIDKSKCVNCGKCRAVCPLNNNEQLKKLSDNSQIYVAHAMDDVILKKSSSGGLFILLSDVVLKKKGVIFGCSMVPDIPGGGGYE